MADKQTQYAAAIAGALQELFNEDSEHCIEQEELAEGDNLTHFMHALANLVPCQMYNGFTSSNKNVLEFNHIANQLVFQYTKKG